MQRKTMRYPGDPDQTIYIMDGAEFKKEIRKGEPGYLKVGPIIGPGLEMDEAQTQTIYFNEVVCDQCHKEILDEDFLAMDRSRAVCKECYDDHWKKWVVS